MSSCQKIMCSKDIKTKKDYHKWAVRGGHPDKGGSTAVFQDVQNCVDANNYCSTQGVPPPSFGAGASKPYSAPPNSNANPAPGFARYPGEMPEMKSFHVGTSRYYVQPDGKSYRLKESSKSKKMMSANCAPSTTCFKTAPKEVRDYINLNRKLWKEFTKWSSSQKKPSSKKKASKKKATKKKTTKKKTTNKKSSTRKACKKTATVLTGPKGGTYYKTKSGKKVYCHAK